MTDQTTLAPPGDRLFALIASIAGSGSVDWCDRVRALLDEVRAEAAAARAQHAGRAVFALKNPLPPGSEHYQSGWDDGLEAAMDAVRAAFEVALASEPDAKADSKPAAHPQPAAPAVWIDGHPQLEAIAAAVWEACGRSDSGACVEDDPRNIAVAALAAVLSTTGPDRAAADTFRHGARDHTIRQGLFNVLTGRAVCPAPRPDDEAVGLLDAYQAEVLADDRAALRDRIADGQGEPAELRDLPREVRHLVHTVDQMRSDWAEASPGSPERQRMWAKVHAACEAVWNRPLSVLPAPIDRTDVLAEVERAIRQATGSCSYRADDGCDYCNGVDAALDQLRGLADEAQPTQTESAEESAPFTEARAAFMQIGRTPSLEGLRAELRIEGQQPLVGRYCGASMGRMHDVPGHEHLLAVDPRLIFEYAEPSAGPGVAAPGEAQQDGAQ